MSNPLSYFTTVIRTHPPLSHEETVNIFEQLLSYGPYTKEQEKARKAFIDRLVLSNLRYVYQLARQYIKWADAHLSLEDLMSAAICGIMRAINKWYPGRLTKRGIPIPFRNYAYNWAKCFVQREIRKRTAQLHKNTFELVPKVLNFIFQFRCDHGYTPTDECVCSALNISYKQLLEVRTAPVDNLDDVAYKNAIVSDKRISSTKFDEESLDIIKNELEKLSIRDKIVINRLFFGPGHCTLKQVGDELGLTRERIRQVRDKTIEKLQVILA